MRATTIAFIAVALVSLTGCHRTKHYEASVELDRVRVVKRDETGKPLTVDVDISYRECPGDQDETIRGGFEFAECMAKHKPGDKVKAKIVHRWDKEGHYKWDVVEVAECKRTVDEHDEASYAMVRECEDWSVNGAKVGFQCNVAPQKALLKACPWFKKH